MSKSYYQESKQLSLYLTQTCSCSTAKSIFWRLTKSGRYMITGKNCTTPKFSDRLQQISVIALHAKRRRPWTRLNHAGIAEFIPSLLGDSNKYCLRKTVSSESRALEWNRVSKTRASCYLNLHPNYTNLANPL